MKKISLMGFTLFNLLVQPCFGENYKINGLTTDQILQEAQDHYRTYYDHILNESERFSKDDMITLFENRDESDRGSKNRPHRGFDEKERLEYHQILINTHEECHKEVEHLTHQIERLKKFHHKTEKDEHLDDLRNLASARSYYKLCEKHADRELHVLF